jgi:hypothetical protein
MRRTLLALPFLAACVPTAADPVTDPQAYAPTSAPIPFAVRQILPRGVTVADIRVADNCYGYVWQGRIYPLLIPRGSQYCI